MLCEVLVAIVNSILTDENYINLMLTRFYKRIFNPMRNTGNQEAVEIVNYDGDSMPALSKYLWKGFVHQLKRFVFVTKSPRLNQITC